MYPHTNISYICPYLYVNVHTKFMHTNAFMPPPPKKNRDREGERKRNERQREKANYLLFLPEELHTEWGRKNMNKVVRAVWWG